MAPLSGFVSFVVAPMLRDELPRMRRMLTRQRTDPALIAELEDAVAAVDDVGGRWATWWRLASVDGSSEAVSTETAGPSRHEITTADAAGLLGVTPRRIVQHLHAGTLTGRRVGRTWLVDRHSVDLLGVR